MNESKKEPQLKKEVKAQETLIDLIKEVKISNKLMFFLLGVIIALLIIVITK